MAWPSRTAASVLSGAGVETLGLDLWDRDAIAASVGWTWCDNPNDFSADVTWTTQYTGYFRMPVWAEATAVITLTFLAKESGGADNGDFRLKGKLFGGAFSTGATTSTALTSLYVPYEVTLAVPASPSWAGAMCEFALEAQHLTAGGTWTVSLQQLFANMRVVPISP